MRNVAQVLDNNLVIFPREFFSHYSPSTRSDDRVSVKLRVTEKVVLLTSPFLRYTTLCDCIEHYTARIDYNQGLFSAYFNAALF